MRYLGGKLPSLAIKAGMSVKFPLGRPFGSTLFSASNLVQTGTPVLFLDPRERKPLKSESGDRQALIDQAKADLLEFWGALAAQV